MPSWLNPTWCSWSCDVFEASSANAAAVDVSGVPHGMSTSQA